MTTISRERLEDGLHKLIVISKQLYWHGWGTLVGFDLYGEGHFSYTPPGHEGPPLIDDLNNLQDGGLIINDMSGDALINTNGIHEYVGFSQATDMGLCNVPLKFSQKHRWLPPPIPGTWQPRTTYYSGEHGTKPHAVSLQGYKLREVWEYRDFETGLFIPVEPHLSPGVARRIELSPTTSTRDHAGLAYGPGHPSPE